MINVGDEVIVINPNRHKYQFVGTVSKIINEDLYAVEFDNFTPLTFITEVHGMYSGGELELVKG